MFSIETHKAVHTGLVVPAAASVCAPLPCHRNQRPVTCTFYLTGSVATVRESGIRINSQKIFWLVYKYNEYHNLMTTILKPRFIISFNSISFVSAWSNTKASCSVKPLQTLKLLIVPNVSDTELNLYLKLRTGFAPLGQCGQDAIHVWYSFIYINLWCFTSSGCGTGAASAMHIKTKNYSV